MADNIEISDLEEKDELYVSEGNAFVMRKGRMNLLPMKIMLYALLKIEDRDNKEYSAIEQIYYRDLKQESTVDYTKGLVAEMDISEVKKTLRKQNSGSFYKSIRELFTYNPHDERSLRNAWAIMMPKPNSEILGYAEIITACHYDTKNGKLFIKFSNEDFVKAQVYELKNEYVSLPINHMMKFTKTYSYRLYEILYCDMIKVDNELKEQGMEEKNEYTFEYQLGNLQLMLGILNVNNDPESKIKLLTDNIDYNDITEEMNKKQKENMYSYSSFRRYVLETAIEEINSMDSSEFTVAYKAERNNERNHSKVTHIIFELKRKKEYEVAEKRSFEDSLSSIDFDFVLQLSKELEYLNLDFEKLSNIAIAADHNMETISSAYQLYMQLGIQENFATWFLNLKK